MRYVVVLVVASILILAPNLIWLATSTVRIENATGEPLASVAYLACETSHSLGSFEPNEARFLLLEACGDDTLEIVLSDARYCQAYVEGDMYHVDARIVEASAVECTYGDLFSSLFILELLR